MPSPEISRLLISDLVGSQDSKGCNSPAMDEFVKQQTTDEFPTPKVLLQDKALNDDSHRPRFWAKLKLFRLLNQLWDVGKGSRSVRSEISFCI